MFFLCYVPFHLTAPFHTIPLGPQSGDLVVHVTVIIFFNRDTDMDSRDSALVPQLSFPQLWYCLGTLVFVLDRNEFIQSKVGPILCTETFLTHRAILYVYTENTHTSANTRTLLHTAVERQSGEKAADKSFIFMDRICSDNMDWTWDEA